MEFKLFDACYCEQALTRCAAWPSGMATLCFVVDVVERTAWTSTTATLCWYHVGRPHCAAGTTKHGMAVQDGHAVLSTPPHIDLTSVHIFQATGNELRYPRHEHSMAILDGHAAQRVGASSQ
ncbi:hypothetical protein A0H81_06593 [Grifola frondosa]|uniref:Uncharacterized protein n=1 Tax=Grifola frondosa TaxID=5627 RepID=A0A1C7ME58_GRIFR|nr:hypothetical protein A0H81_06593 [Grifola frondosa]